MHFELTGTLFAALIGLTSTEKPGHPDLDMRGDRFKPLTYVEMTPEQRKMTDNILGGERGSMHGPYNVMLRSPEMGDLAQRFGAHIRFYSSLSKKLNELAILMTARAWKSPFVWYIHRKFGIAAGLNAHMIDSLATGQRPVMDPDEAIVFEFCEELLNTRRVSDATFQKTKERFGERGIVDLIGVMGYYQLVSMLLNVDRYPLPVGATDELNSPG
jgi:4-carboxymuconolactone decarboxylase